jgi:hypothetical protein
MFFSGYLFKLFSFGLGTKREAELDDVSPTKLKALKAARNGTNGGVVDEDSNHKNGDEHLPEDDEDDDDDVCSKMNEWF